MARGPLLVALELSLDHAYLVQERLGAGCGHLMDLLMTEFSIELEVITTYPHRNASRLCIFSLEGSK